MMRGMNAAISGLEAHQTMLDVTANNLANFDTIGYKAQRTTFQDELSQTLSAPTGPNGYNGGQNAKQVGLGVQVGSIDNLMGTGSLQTTGNALDIYIQGDGFLQVGNGAPGTTAPYTSNLPSSVQYTRAGNLTLNSAGFLTSQSGQYIVGATAPSTSSSSTPTYINVPPGSTNIAVGQNGAVSYTDENSSNTTYGQTVTAGYLSLATFPNSAGLERDGGSLWSATASSGPGHHRYAERRRFRPDDRRLAGDVERRHGDRVHQHDHRRAQLPGQLQGHHHRRHDAVNGSEHGAGLIVR